jgi:hypothetical protein
MKIQTTKQYSLIMTEIAELERSRPKPNSVEEGELRNLIEMAAEYETRILTKKILRGGR